MTRKPARVYAPGEFEAELVAPAVSPDQTRAHLCKPFGQEFQGAGWICGTDGHRLHALQSEHWVRHVQSVSPPANEVIPWGAKWRGEIVVAGLDAARYFPARWDVQLEVQPKALLARVGVRAGTGKPASIHPFGRGGVPVDWFRPLEQLTYAFGIQLDYLLDAIDFVGAGIVQVWSNDAAKYQDTEPLAFSAGARVLSEAKRIAVVMPRRLQP